MKVVVAGGIAVFVLLFGWLFCTRSVPAGHIGIVTSFGYVESGELDPGIHIVLPWKKVHALSLQTQEDKETASVPTKEGLTVSIEVSLLYSLKKESASDVFSSVGKDYLNVIVQPQLRSALRGATVNYEAKDLYTSHRSEIEAGLEKTVRAMLAERGIECEKVLFRSIDLPVAVKSAIEDKLAAEQKAQQMQFTIQKETQEAERKRVEAQGIADSQEIIHATLTDNYLRYLWIEGLKTAAEHNGTIIYVPTGSDGLPFFKDVNPAGKTVK